MISLGFMDSLGVDIHISNLGQRVGPVAEKYVWQYVSAGEGSISSEEAE